jgi:hypothetical protein
LKNYLEAQKAFSEAYLYTYNDYSLEKLNEVEQKLKVEIQIKNFFPEVINFRERKYLFEE